MTTSSMTRVELEAAYAATLRVLNELEDKIRMDETRKEGGWYRAGYILRVLERAREERKEARKQARAKLGAVTVKERKARCYAAFL